MSNSNFQFLLRPSSDTAQLTVTVSLDNTVVYGPTVVISEQTVTVPLSDDSGVHQLHIDLSGKLPEHTTIDTNGAIVSDAVIEVVKPMLDATELHKIFFKLSRYQHTTNGTTDAVDQPFYGIMGCNGRVTLSFETPAYLWLLDNM